MLRSQLKKVLQTFCPSAPTTDPSKFVGREQECSDLAKALLAPGRHAVVFGDRGVGKTSTARYVAESICKSDDLKFIEYQCGTYDTYSDIASKILGGFGQLSVTTKKTDSHEQMMTGAVKAVIAAGELHSKRTETTESTDLIQANLTADHLASYLKGFGGIVLLDEFDRIKDERTKGFLAELFKALSNYRSPLKFILCGVSNTSADLIGAHESMYRNLKPVRIPYMPNSELRKIINDGLAELSLGFSSGLRESIVWLSCGLPYFTHLLCEELATCAVTNNQRSLGLSDLRMGAQSALRNIADGVEAEYRHATSYAPTVDMIFGGHQLSPTPSRVKRYVIHAVALTAANNGSRPLEWCKTRGL
jgi:Cdc6-like AAA superfamily ATPase